MAKRKKLFIDEYNLPWSISHYIQRNMQLVEIDSGIEIEKNLLKLGTFLVQIKSKNNFEEIFYLIKNRPKLVLYDTPRQHITCNHDATSNALLIQDYTWYTYTTNSLILVIKLEKKELQVNKLKTKHDDFDVIRKTMSFQCQSDVINVQNLSDRLKCNFPQSLRSVGLIDICVIEICSVNEQLIISPFGTNVLAFNKKSRYSNIMSHYIIHVYTTISVTRCY
jgi:hypothetical protein